MGVSPWWLVIVVFFTWALGASYYPEVVSGIAPLASYALGLASVLLLFLSILAHEFGHAIVARRHGIEIEEIDLWLLGGVSRMRGEAHEPGDEFRYAIAGPAVTAVIGVCFGVAALLLPSSTPPALMALVEYEAYVNGAILVLNLMPAFPLDGGRVLRSLLWRRGGQLGPATARAAAIGRGFGYLLVALGGLEFLSGAPEGLWFALIGFFIVTAAGQEARGAELSEALSGVHAGELMSSPVIGIPAGRTIGQAASEYFARYRYTAFPVLDERGRALGLLGLPQVESAELRRDASLAVAEVADRDPDLLVAEDLDVVRLLQRPAFGRVGRAVVVDREGRPVGLVSITDVQRALRAARLTRPGEGMAAAVLCLFALICGVAAGAPGSARAAWSAPVTVSAPHDAIGSVHLAEGLEGYLLSWQSNELEMPARDVFGPALASYATAPVDGVFGPERPLPASFTTGPLVNLGSGLSGGLLGQLVFRRTGIDTSEPEVALGRIDGSFSKPLRIHASVWNMRASLVGNERGELLLAWIASPRSGLRQVWASTRFPGGQFGAPQLISGSADAQQVSAVMGGAVHSTARPVFAADMAVAFPSRRGRMLVAVRLHGEGWGPVQDVGPAAVGSLNESVMAIGRNSRVAIAWFHQQLSEGGPLGPGVMQVAVRGPNARRFLPAQTLERDPNASLAIPPVLVWNYGRGLVLAFVAQPGRPVLGFAPSMVRVSYSRGNRFGPAQTISPAGQQVGGLAAAEGTRGEIVAWSAGPNPPGSALSPRPAIYAAVNDLATARLGAVRQVTPAEGAELPSPAFASSGESWVMAWRGLPEYSSPTSPGRAVVRVARCSDACQ